MQLTVRRKLQYLLAGSLVGTLLLVAGAMSWIIGLRHDQRAGHEAHAMLHDIGRHVIEIERQLALRASTLAQRQDIIAALGLLTDYAAPADYQPLIHDAEKKSLAELFARYALEQEIAAYDGNAQFVAYARSSSNDGDAHLAIASQAGGRPQVLGTAANANHWRPFDLPAGVPDSATAFGKPAEVTAGARRTGHQLVLEALTPVRRLQGGTLRTIGWLRVSQPLAVERLNAFAAPRGISITLLFSAAFDQTAAHGFTPQDFADAPDLRVLLRAHQPIESLNSEIRYVDTAALPLADGETAWLLSALDRAAVQASQRDMRMIVLAALAGTLLLVLPLAGWLLQCWIGKPLEMLRVGVHDYAQGNIHHSIDLHGRDEFALLAEDFNLLAVALRVREIAIKEAEERWRTMIEAIEGSEIGLYIVGNDLQLEYVSRSVAARIAGAATGMPCHQAIFGNPERCSFCPLPRVIGLGETVRFQPPPTDGRHYDIIAMPVGSATGQRRLMTLIQDVTERVASERTVHEAAAVFDATSEAIMITDAEGVIKRVNPAFTATTGYAAAEAVGQTPQLLKSTSHDSPHYREMWSSLKQSGRWEGEVWNRRKSGEIFPAWQTISAMRDAAGGIIEYVSLFIDITERKRSEAEIAYRANYDTLTGLPNRTLLTERLGQAIKQARREDSSVAVLFIDLDFFKQVNDSLGHAVGDRLLQLVAERMRQCIRETDTIARQGGDEFVVLLAAIEDAATAALVAEKIIAQLTQPFLLDGHEIHIGASIGITLFPADGQDIETLFRNADLAMYRAKEAGRNNAQFFELAMTTAALERRTLEADLRGALGRAELRLCYQPVVHLMSGRIAGAEALLRWQHPQRGLVGPDQFIPLAEETGLIREIGAWVFTTGCRQLAAWQADGHSLTLALNVSVRQLPDALPVSQILATLAQHRLSPGQIVLEITEGALLADSPGIRDWFVAAGAAGLQLAIDDFGTGYSSLAYLKRFPVHHVKIDREFVRDMVRDAADRALVEAILAMAHSLGLAVVAEGVETQEQADLLAARACEQAQGYLYSRPVPAEEFTALLAQPGRAASSAARRVAAAG